LSSSKHLSPVDINYIDNKTACVYMELYMTTISDD
jgi:hypothetical protein